MRASRRREGRSGGGVRGLWALGLPAETDSPPPPESIIVSLSSGRWFGGTQRSEAAAAVVEEVSVCGSLCGSVAQLMAPLDEHAGGW